MKTWAILAWCGLAAAGMGSVARMAAQQDPIAAMDKAATADAQNETAPAEEKREAGALSAERLIRMLRSNPEIMVEAKALLGDSIQDGAEADAQPGNPTDDQLYSRIQQSPEVRARLSRFLLARGYIDDRDASMTRAAASIEVPVEQEDDPSGSAEQPGPSLPVGSRPTRRDSTRQGFSLGRSGSSRDSKRIAAEREKQDGSSITDEPAALHRPAPFNLRSLRDLYTQAPDAAEHLKRFGSEVFTARGDEPDRTMEGTATPLGPDYVLGPGDELSITIWGGTSQSVMRRVDGEGRVALPEAGLLQVAGLTLGRAEDVVRQALQPQFRNAQVAVTVARIRTIEVFVVGDVQRPGAYQISALGTPVTALMAAGGPTAHGSLRVMRHMRGDHAVGEIDLYDFLLRGVSAWPHRIQSGDTLLVPPVGAQVAVLGAVKRPAIYELLGEKTLESVLSDAGGLTVAAELGQVTVQRFTNSGRREVSLGSATESPETLNLRVSQFEVKDGDRIRVGGALPVSDRAIYVQGHVARPGKIAYRDGMQLTDVIRSYRDLLPEPSDTGEVVRLVPPDMHPETIEFNVADAMIGNVPLPLQPFDTIRIFGRYEQDAPMVTVRGEVQRPGAYPLFKGMTAAQLVRTAGGFKRAAFLKSADLVSYHVAEDSHVSTERQEVAIGSAVLDGNQKADTRLKAGDVLTVHQLTSWNDIGASIAIEGEVAHPGSYGFKDGEHLSDVLRRAGGLLPAAYAEGAVLTRPEVARLEEKNRESLIRQIEAGASAARTSPGVGGSDQAATLQLIQQQQEQVLSDLRKQPAVGRLVIHISSHMEAWAGTAADIELRNGDTLRIPKRPAFVLISGQVYNAAAITFEPGESASWYLRHAGGANSVASRRDIFIIRANGSVVGRGSNSWYGHDVLSTRLEPGDTIVVPQKIVGASLLWRNLVAGAQVAASLAIAASVVGL